MEGEKQTLVSLNCDDLVQFSWTTSAALKTTDKFYLDDPRRKSCFEHHETLALTENLSESAPDLSIKSKSVHQVTPQRLCKSAETLLSKRCKQQHRKQPYGCTGWMINEVTQANLKCGKRFAQSTEFESNRRWPFKNMQNVIPVEKKMLHVGDLNQITSPLSCSLCLADYRTNWAAPEKESKIVLRLNIDCLFKHLKHLGGLLMGYGILRETRTGSIVAEFTNLEDMDRVLRLPLSKIFGRKIKSWCIVNQQHLQRQHYASSPRRRWNNYCCSYRQCVIATGIPDTVSALEIQNALRFQGLNTGQVWHMPRGCYIEVLRPSDYDRLCREGVNFFNVAAFPVYAASQQNLVTQSKPTAGSKYPDNRNTSELKPVAQETAADIPFAILQQAQHKENIQCFNCQRYGHKAARCKYWTRCVRCGGKHKLSNCDVPMAAASCCLCKGAHHAASHECPVHNVHIDAVQVTFAMARTNFKSSTSSFGDCGSIY